MCNDHFKKLCSFKEAIENYLTQIFQVYGKELELRLEELNLLDNENNCLESSTAFGFVLEEFIVSKLECYTGCFEEGEGYRIKRSAVPTTTVSYDCYGYADDIQILINIKVVKKGQSNDAIGSINRIILDYVGTDPEVKKGFLVLKVNYNVDLSRNPLYQHRKIHTGEISSFFLDEIDLSHEHQQDNRSWSQDGHNHNSGRLKISDAFRRSHQLPVENISYKNTCKMLNDLHARNERNELFL